ncbi:MAG TPA: SCO family protein [Bryobacteraceae bacterium]|nr:SCO family protein [Bryobacteraceae bacterium]
MNRLVPIALLAVFAMGAEREYQVTGLVLRADAQRRRLIVSEDAIEGYMEAMVMEYDVTDAHILAGLKPGTKIAFTLVVGEKSSRIRDIQTRSYESAERDPALMRRLDILDKALGDSGATIAQGQLVPDFALVDQLNRPVKLSEFAGKVAAITFIYTRCPLPDYCLRMTGNFGALQRRFRKRLGRDLVLLSISFDPAHDHPDVLAKYADTWKPDRDGWRFLTGDLGVIKRVCAEFGMNFWPDEGLFTHSLHTVIVGRDRRMIANLEGNQFTSQQLGDLIETALK